MYKIVILEIKPNAPPAAAVRVLLVLTFAYMYHLQVWGMPAYGKRPHCSADGSLGNVIIKFEF